MPVAEVNEPSGHGTVERMNLDVNDAGQLTENRRRGNGQIIDAANCARHVAALGFFRFGFSFPTAVRAVTGLVPIYATAQGHCPEFQHDPNEALSHGEFPMIKRRCLPRCKTPYDRENECLFWIAVLLIGSG